MVSFNSLLSDTLDNLLTVKDGLVRHDFAALCLTVHLVGDHGLWDQVDFDAPYLLPTELVGASEADVLTLRPSKEHKTLNDLWVPHHAVVEQILQQILPFFILIETKCVNFDRSVLMLDIAQFIVDFRVFNLMHAISLFILLSHKLLLEVGAVLLSLLEVVVLDSLGKLSGISLFSSLISLLLLLESCEAAVPVASKCHFFLRLPDLDESLDGFERKTLLIVSELTVLAHRIKANNIPLVLSAEVIKFNLGELAFFWDPLLARSNALIALSCLLLFPSLALLILLSALLCHIFPIRDGLSQRVIKQAALVDKRECHEAAEAGHALVVHARLANDLLHVNVLKALHEAQLANFLLAFSIKSRNGLALTSIVFSKDVVSEAKVVVEDSTFHELMRGARLASVDELNHLVLGSVLMRLVISIDGDFTLGVLKAAHIHTRCASVLLQEVHKLREVIGEVLRLLKCLKELSFELLIGLRILHFLLLFALLDLATDAKALLLGLNLLDIQNPLQQLKSNGLELVTVIKRAFTYLLLFALLGSTVEQVLGEVLLGL